LTAGAGIRGRDKTMVAGLVRSAVAAFGLEHVLGLHPQELPFSMRKRIAMAATVACGTPWIILDEPTLGQDDYSAGQLARYIVRLVSSGAGVIIISHSESFISHLPVERVTLKGGTFCK
jgi:energy-coupling factor transport system ATP-binding protein